MKTSIKRRVAFTFIILMASALLLIGVINVVFLDGFYLREKQNRLRKSWEMFNEEIDEDTEEVSEEIERFCSVSALTYAVVDYNLNFRLTNAQDGDSMASRLFGNVLQIEEDNTTTLLETDQYNIIKIHDDFKNMDYLELWGFLEKGYYYIAITPLESINTAAKLSMRFYTYVGLIVILASSIIIWLLTRRLVKPVQELTEISKKMAELDFNAHYESGGEDEIGKLGENFNTMSEKLEQAISELKTANLQLRKDIDEKTKIDVMRREFLGNVSHELKTPIALIQGYAEGLKDIADDPESREFYCDVIIDESAKMNQMVKQLLTLNQLESGTDQLVLARFDLTALIRGVIGAMQIMISQAEADVRFRQEKPLYVWGDEFRIEEVVTNYLSNAIHHLAGDHLIDISCAERDGIVTTTVFNRGKPIPEEDLSRIWEKFYKVDKAHTRAYGGSGIGLSIVRAIMEQHGQTCAAENREDGVAFSFTLESKVSL